MEGCRLVVPLVFVGFVVCTSCGALVLLVAAFAAASLNLERVESATAGDCVACALGGCVVVVGFSDVDGVAVDVGCILDAGVVTFVGLVVLGIGIGILVGLVVLGCGFVALEGDNIRCCLV